jgi:uncharacterized integral membrane protein (TIGR00698 family)
VASADRTAEQARTAADRSAGGPLAGLRRSLPPLLPGLIAAVIVGALSLWLAGYAPRIGSVTIAIVLGVLVGNVVLNRTDALSMARMGPGLKYGEKRLLPVAVALLGVELQLAVLVGLGLPALVIIAASVGTSVVFAIGVGERLGFTRRMSILIGAGNGICGSSAVAASGAAIDADEEEMGISISVVNLLGTMGIVLMPLLATVLAFSETRSGLLIGGTLQAVGQVVAAGFSVNDDVGRLATVVKMGRVLLLGPMVVLIALHMRAYMRRVSPGEAMAVDGYPVPKFVIGFFALSILASLGIFPPDVVGAVQTVSKFLLAVAMAAIGMQIQFAVLFRSGAKAFGFGALVWAVQTAVVLGLLLVLE